MSNAVLASEELVPKIVDSLKTKVSEFHFNNWFKSASWSLEDENQAIIHVPNRFVRDWISENFLEIIRFEFFKLTGREFQIHLRVHQQYHHQQTTHAPKKVETVTAPAIKAPAKISPHPSSGLNPRYSFHNFVVGNSNQFVNAACLAVANNPAKNYNPLFIYGGVGLGKTHLLNAIGLQALEKNPHWKIVMVTGERFTNEVINCIRYDKTYDLRKKYRIQCDLLLIDDVQFIAGKERTMEEFFHTFNTLYEARKQIVMTSDTLPKDIPHLEERLRSRCSWGLLADIQAPDFETRCAILRKKAEDEKLLLPDDVCQFIASSITTNVRDLEGSLIRASAFASLAGVPLTIDLAREVLRNISRGFTPSVTIEKVQETVASHFNLHVADLKSARRHKNLAVPRQIAMYLCKKHVKASYPEIGHRFGGKDHTTVIHAFRKVSQSLGENDHFFRENIEKLEKTINS